MLDRSLGEVVLSEQLLESHALQACWDAQLAGLSADALNLALGYGVFAHLDQFIAAEELALVLKWDADNTAYLLELLWSLELLECQWTCPRRYRSLPQTARYLNPGSAQYCGDALLFRHGVLRQVGNQLDELLRNGKSPPADPALIQQGWAAAARSQIAQEQTAVTAEVACEIFGAVPEFWQAQRLLDLGGGPGLVAIALAQQQQDLNAVVFEYEAAAVVAQQKILDAGLEARVNTLAGDLLVDDFGADYDLIWCSSVLHFVPDIPALLARLYRALRPGGVLVCCHAEVHTEVSKAKRILHYYLHMRMQGRHVLPEGQLAQLLEQAGFDDVQQFDEVRFPVAPVTALIARKACKG